MELQLSPQEQDYLSRAVNRYLRELETEIAHTDAREFREELKNEFQMFDMLREKLGANHKAPASAEF